MSIRRACLGLSVAGVLVATAACGSAGDDASDAGPSAVSPASTTGTPTETPAATTSSPAASASTTASPTPTAYPTTSTAHTEPWNDKNADFGFVTAAKAVSGGVEFTFDRATWLFAKDVPAWNKANPTHKVLEADDYAIGNVSTKKRTFLLRTGAKVFGSIILSDQPEHRKITAAQFLSRVNSAYDGVTCWIYHRYGGLTGDVVQLEEQYRP